MITIDDHTFDETKLSGGWVIDAGCRGFALPVYFLKKTEDCKVFALDIDNNSISTVSEIFVMAPEFLKVKHAALTTHSGQTEAYLFGDGTGNFIAGINNKPSDTPERPLKIETVPCITLQDIYNEIGTDIDLLKLDIEGAEYEILENIEPIPKQITVEFHEHCHPERHNLYIDKIMDHLCKYYHCNLYIRDWPRYKYQDCLFIRKDLI